MATTERDRGRPHRRAVPRRAARRRPRDLAERREDHPPARASRARGGRADDGPRLRPPARARRRDAGAGARHRRAGERHPPDPALEGGPRATPAGGRADGGADRGADGADARLFERHVRVLRRALRRVGAARERSGRGQHRRLPARDARPRSLDDALDHEPPGRPHEARGRAGGGRGGAAQDRRDREPHHRARRAHVATLAPYADELTIYPGSDIRPQDERYALSFAIPMGTPGLKFICRDSYSKERDPFDYPLSSRFDEMDAVAIFDDVEVPKNRVFLDGDTVGYSEVISDTGWRGHIMHQAFTPPTSSCRSRSGSAISSPTRPAWGGSTTSRRSSGRCGTWSS